MFIQMKSTRRENPDGFAVHQYHKGSIYNLPDTLAVYFVNMGWAVEIRAKEVA